jgi:hypothetical protein
MLFIFIDHIVCNKWMFLSYAFEICILFVRMYKYLCRILYDLFDIITKEKLLWLQSWRVCLYLFRAHEILCRGQALLSRAHEIIKLALEILCRGNELLSHRRKRFIFFKMLYKLPFDIIPRLDMVPMVSAHYYLQWYKGWWKYNILINDSTNN